MKYKFINKNDKIYEEIVNVEWKLGNRMYSKIRVLSIWDKEW